MLTTVATATSPIAITVVRGHTSVTVTSWPYAQHTYVVNSTTRSDGAANRGLRVSCWFGQHTTSGFVTGVGTAATIDIHVDGRRPLLLYNHEVSPSLVETDRRNVIGNVVACAVDVADQLHSGWGIGTGTVEWRFASTDVLYNEIRDTSTVLRPVGGSYATGGTIRYLGTTMTGPSAG